MKSFLDNSFLLYSKTAEKLYHEYAANMPIYDYHCHLEAEDIAQDRRYDNITEVWLGGDHYKWRLMRANGVTEDFITGSADPLEKFIKWAETLEITIGNPLYHWSQMEMRRYFNVTEPLCKKNAKAVYDQCNEIIRSKSFSARQVIAGSNVAALCTTDNPISDLKYHKILKDSDFKTAVRPTFRPELVFNLGMTGWKDYLTELGKVTGTTINNFDELVNALYARIDYFSSVGCKLSDQCMEPPVYVECDKATLNSIVQKALKGEATDATALNAYRTALMQALGEKYADAGWAMQLHIAAMRDNNSRMFAKLGANTGYDSMGDYEIAWPLSRFLDSLDKKDKLPKTIMYSLNAGSNDILAAMAGNFQGDGVPGKMQFGSAWWFNDHKDGMEAQMRALANVGLLARFIGMLTDSRSILSYTRHDYFR
ncbi:MAG: glucuronate isomerase, partial [Deferribacteraceae bacterium]|nr:glucuronate isomerase [Deferribacteraceae bacterium]